MQTEILNIQWHVRELVIKALNRYDNKNEAAKVLGIGVRTLYNMIAEHKIVLGEDQQYRAEEKMMVQIYAAV